MKIMTRNIRFFPIILFLCIQLCYIYPIVNSAILRRGNPLSFNQAKQYLQSVRKSGIIQFIHHYHRVKDIKTPKFLWGDELEYGIFKYDDKLKSYDLAICRGANIQESLSSIEKKLSDLPYGCLWQPEYGSWMVEAVPRDPYDGFVSSLLRVEKSMQLRRKRLHSVIQSNEIAPSLSAFPLLGVPGLDHSTNDIKSNPFCCPPSAGNPTDTAMQQSNNISMSSYIKDNVINPHPRFGALTKNIRMRRGKKVNIKIPKEIQENSSDNLNNPNNMIHMDAMAFGMGCCCLQVTMQSASNRESRFLHDQLAIMAPLFLALSASTPILKGYLAGTDTRWDVISQAVDDRTSAEAGEIDLPYSATIPNDELAGRGIKRIYKSRYSSVSRFIGKPSSMDESSDLESLNDIDANIDEDFYKMIKSNGNIDSSLAKHIAHLFIRDPLVIFDDAIYLDDEKVLDHFENIQSTNWRTIRWKTPALEIGLEAQKRKYEQNLYTRFALRKTSSMEGEVASSDNKESLEQYGPGWRVEFRPLEIQLTDFENAAYAITIVLLTRSLLAMRYNFYLPISYVEENMRRAQLKDAAIEQKFYFRRQSFDGIQSQSQFQLQSTKSNESVRTPTDCGDSTTINTSVAAAVSNAIESVDEKQRLVPSPNDIDIVELSLHEIFNGSQQNGVIGIVPAILCYLETLGTSSKTMKSIQKYLDLLSKRASGELPTTAKWIRSYVKNHPNYNKDGKINFEITSDLLKVCDDIGMGRIQCPELVGTNLIDHLCPEEAFETYLDSSRDITVHSVYSNNIQNTDLYDQSVEDIDNQNSNAKITFNESNKNVNKGKCNDNVNEELMKKSDINEAYLM